MTISQKIGIKVGEFYFFEKLASFSKKRENRKII